MHPIKVKALFWLNLSTYGLLITVLFFSSFNVSYSHNAPTIGQAELNTATQPSKTPRVIASIPPFYLLGAAIMKGVGSPILLVKPGASPHDYHLKPSEVRALHNADLIIWGGPELETFLMTPIKNLSTDPKIHVLELDKTPGLDFLPIRAEFAHAAHNHHHAAHEHKHTAYDMHFWLDPQNAILLAEQIVKSLSAIDPAHAEQYKNNGDKFKQQILGVDKSIEAKLKPVHKIPYLVFHDAYRYFEKRYALNNVAAVTLHPELPPSAKRLSTIQQIIQTEHVRCIFTEPQFPDKMVKGLIKGTDIGTVSIDPLGSQYLHSTDGYVMMLEGLANSIEGCLKQY